MALFNKKSSEVEDSHSKIDCILDVDTIFSGELESTGSIIINGTLRGKKLLARGNIILGETGTVEVETLVANDVKISGHIFGNIDAKNKIEITEKGKLYGDIQSQRLQIIEGGIFEGSCNMGVVKEEIKPSLEFVQNVVPLK